MMKCRNCGKTLSVDTEGEEWFPIYKDVNDMAPEYALCCQCFQVELEKLEE